MIDINTCELMTVSMIPGAPAQSPAHDLPGPNAFRAAGAWDVPGWHF